MTRTDVEFVLEAFWVRFLAGEYIGEAQAELVAVVLALLAAERERHLSWCQSRLCDCGLNDLSEGSL